MFKMLEIQVSWCYNNPCLKTIRKDVVMIKKLHTKLKPNIGIMVCVIILATAFLTPLLYTPPSGVRAEYSETSYKVSVYPVNGEVESSEAEEIYGYAVYINGVYITSGEDKEILLGLLDKAAENQAAAEYGNFLSVNIEDETHIKYEKLDAIDQPDAAEQAISQYVLTLTVIVTEEREREVGFDTLYVDDSDTYQGTEQVVREGEKGITKEFYLVTYTDGIKTNEKHTRSEVVTKPVSKIIKKGIKVKTDQPKGLKMFIMPYDGRITSEYSTRYLLGGTFHGGLDLASKERGEPCYGDLFMAAGDGVVVFSDYSGEFGILTIIEHPNGIRTYYAHQSQTLVKAGNKVKQGDYIGKIGSTGLVTGPHLHFEVRLPDGNGGYYRVDPGSYIIDYEKYIR